MIAELLGRRRIRLALIWSTVAVAVYALLGFFALPPLVRSIAVRKLAAELHRPVGIERVEINPFVLSVRVLGLSVKERNGGETFFSASEIYANFQLSSLLRRGPVVRELTLASPYLRVVRNPDQSYNFSDLLVRPAPPPGQESKPLRYSLNNIQVERGSLDFDDLPKHARHTVRDLYLGIPFLSNLPYQTEIFVEPAFQAKVNGSRLALYGKTKPFSDSLETSVEIDVRDVDLPPYLAYVPNPTAARLLAGRLGLHLTLAFTQYRNRPPTLLLSGKTSLAGAVLADAAGRPALTCPLLDVSIASADVLARRFELKSVLLQGPRLEVRREPGGAWNLAAMSPAGTGGGPAAGGAAPAFTLDVAATRIEDGEVDFTDEQPHERFAATIRPVNAAMQHFSTVAGKAAALEISLASDAGEKLGYTGEFTFEPLAAGGDVTLEGVPLKRYMPYLRDLVAFDVAGGEMRASSHFLWRPAGTTVSGLAIGLDGLRLRLRGADADFLSVPSLTLSGTAADTAKREMTAGELAVHRAAARAVRAADGAWDVMALMPPASPPAAGAAAAAGAEPPPWVVTLAKLAVERGAVEVVDRVPHNPVTTSVAPVDLAAEGLSTIAGRGGSASLRCTVNRTGTLTLRGPVTLNPVGARLALKLHGLGVVPFQGYLQEFVRLVVNDGAVSADGELTVATDAQGRYSTAYAGDASLDHLATVDAASAEDFLKWDSLALHGIRMRTEPAALELAEAALSGCAVRFTMREDGSLNVRAMMGGAPPPADETVATAGAAPETTAPAAPAAAAASAPSAATAPSDVRIERVTVRDSTIGFVDRTLTPAFAADITHLEGTISGLSSLATSAADVDLRATLDNSAPIELKGKVNPLSTDLFLNVAAGCRGIEMTTLSPYSGKYAGYAIKKGKLTLGLDYKVDKRKLESQNKLFLDQFDFGDKIASPQATKMPVRLAVALLKDREGRINLDLPVSGSLDDPKFRVGRVVLKMIENLLIKVATSPFALLGSLVGGNDDLSTVAFGAGSSDLEAGEIAKLQKLGKVLIDRPALKIEIEGKVDAKADGEALRRAKVEERLGEAGDRAKALVAEWTKLQGKPVDPKALPPAAAIEAELVAHEALTPDDLAELASDRADEVQEKLLEVQGLAPERVFVTAPKPDSGASGAAMSLK